MKLRELITNEAADKIVKLVSDWYQWSVENTSNHEVPAFTAKVGHISNENMSVLIETEAGDTTIDLEKWFVKGIAKGKNYRFGRKAMK